VRHFLCPDSALNANINNPTCGVVVQFSSSSTPVEKFPEEPSKGLGTVPWKYESLNTPQFVRAREVRFLKTVQVTSNCICTWPAVSVSSKYGLTETKPGKSLASVITMTISSSEISVYYYSGLIFGMTLDIQYRVLRFWIFRLPVRATYMKGDGQWQGDEWVATGYDWTLLHWMSFKSLCGMYGVL
jgi:hypothetical protein